MIRSARLVVSFLAVGSIAGCAPSPPPVVAPRPCPAAPAPGPAAPTGPTAADPLTPHPLVEHARAFFAALDRGRCTELSSRLSESMAQALPAPKLEAMCTSLEKAKGATRGLAIERLGATEGRFTLSAERGSLELTLNLDDEGKISGFGLREPPKEPPPVQTAGPFLLPFSGEWTVFWGGDNLRDNKHLTHVNQRRAADLLATGTDGKSHTGDGTKNEDYLAYGKPVLAAAAGRVVTVVDGVPDNPPGQVNEYAAVGNMVVVQHRDAAYAVYAHLKPGSIRVREGQEVRAGQPLGQVGNSGRSNEPHLHFHVQSTRELAGALGMEPIFEGVEVERGGAWQPVEAYRFQRGDRIRARKR